MFEADVMCANDDCKDFFRYKCEYESAGDGSIHQAKCPHCKKLNEFEISYSPTISGERIVD